MLKAVSVYSFTYIIVKVFFLMGTELITTPTMPKEKYVLNVAIDRVAIHIYYSFHIQYNTSAAEVFSRFIVFRSKRSISRYVKRRQKMFFKITRFPRVI